MIEEAIQRAARQFRTGIEACRTSLGATYRNFPKGACGDSALMLGTYLIDLGLGEFEYMLGDYGCREAGTWCSHAWLRSNDLIVDITADQFPEVTEKVVVCRHSGWHQMLHGKAVASADYRTYDQGAIRRLDRLYHVITGAIRNVGGCGRTTL